MPSPTPHAATRLQLLAAVAACEDKKGEDTRILELDPADSGLADFFLITSASNDRQVVAIADEIEYRLKKEFGLYAVSVEGRRQGEWILLDYTDIVIHVFLAEKRAFYDIERLRKSARNLTGAEVEAELKTALAEKTRAVRKSTPAPKKAAKKAAPIKAAAKKAAKKASPVKAATKKASPKAVPAAKKGAKEVVAKAPVKAAKKAVAKATAKPVKKVAVKAAKKTVAKAPKAPAKKAAKKSIAKKAVRK